MQALDAPATLRERPPKRCSPECSSCSSTANIWQPSKARRTDHLTSPEQQTVAAETAMQQQQQAAALPVVAAVPGATQQHSARTQHLLRLLVLLRARRQLRSTSAAGQQQPQQQQQQQQLCAAPVPCCPHPQTPCASHQLAAALCGTRACIDTGLQHLRAAASLLTAGCDSSQAEAALAAAEAALAHSIHNLSLAKAAAVQQLAGQLRAAAAAAADDDLQDTCCSSMTCYPAA
uniref:Uncharacterized protein n=1 Tax=Tetradesmus obliquus TaxID=3088 RepID=A0A383W5G4_TETOB|eukprot:jgi/Sobl393_1/12123/SZX72875.1